MINNRQAGRRRGRGGGNNPGPRSGGQQGNGSRIDSRARGNASQLFEKYKNMAADAQRVSDRVNTEYYLQFADHYFRVLSEQRGRFEDQQPRARNDGFDMDGDGEFGGNEFGDEGEPARNGGQWNDGNEAPRLEGRDDRPRDDRPRDDRPREFRRDEGEPRRNANNGSVDGGPRRSGNTGGGEGEPRRAGNTNANGGSEGRREWQDRDRQGGDRQGGDRQGADRQGADRQGGDRPERQDRPDRQRERRPVEAQAAPEPSADRDVGGQHRADPVVPGESLNSRAEAVLNADRPLDAPPARRRGRPRREDVAAVDESNGFEADRLPPPISLPPAIAANDEEPVAKPRRRRVRSTDETPTAAE